MMGVVILGIVIWLLLSVAVALTVAVIARAGLQEDRVRGFLVDHR
jgi:hypothetical protein